MAEPCVFPTCRDAADVRRADGSLSCALHEHVTVTGSWVPDRHNATSHE